MMQNYCTSVLEREREREASAQNLVQGSLLYPQLHVYNSNNALIKSRDDGNLEPLGQGRPAIASQALPLAVTRKQHTHSGQKRELANTSALSTAIFTAPHSQ